MKMFEEFQQGFLQKTTCLENSLKQLSPSVLYKGGEREIEQRQVNMRSEKSSCTDQKLAAKKEPSQVLDAGRGGLVWEEGGANEVAKVNTSKAMLRVTGKPAGTNNSSFPRENLLCFLSGVVGLVGWPTFSGGQASQRSVRVDVSDRILVRGHPVRICCSGTQQQAGYLQFEHLCLVAPENPSL